MFVTFFFNITHDLTILQNFPMINIVLLKSVDNSDIIKLSIQRGRLSSSFTFSLKTCTTYQQFNRRFETFAWIRCYPMAILI